MNAGTATANVSKETNHLTVSSADYGNENTAVKTTVLRHGGMKRPR